MALDIASHWVQMKAAGQMHHKSSSRNFIVSFYYSNYYFFGYCCCGAEFFYILMYILRFLPAGNVSLTNGLLHRDHVHAVAFYVMLPGTYE